jgi:hypothetical protein
LYIQPIYKLSKARAVFVDSFWTTAQKHILSPRRRIIQNIFWQQFLKLGLALGAFQIGSPIYWANMIFMKPSYDAIPVSQYPVFDAPIHNPNVKFDFIGDNI